MARGRLLRTKVREAKAIAKAAAEGEIVGKIAGHKKKPLAESLREHIGRWLDNMDPLKLVSIIGVAVVIKTSVEWGEDVYANVAAKPWFMHIMAVVNPLIWALNPGDPQTTKVIGEALDTPQVEAMEWVISIALAYLVVEHFGEIVQGLGSAVGSIKSLATGFLAA